MALMTDVPVHSTITFFWHPEEGIFTSDASSFKHRRLADRVYDDAADFGFFLESARTGRKLLFVHVDTVATADGDVAFWKFQNVSKGLTVKVFNDIDVTIRNIEYMISAIDRHIAEYYQNEEFWREQIQELREQQAELRAELKELKG